MSNHQDDAEGGAKLAGWWIAAAVAVLALFGATLLLTGTRPSPAQLQAAHTQSQAEAQIDDAAYGAQLSAAHAAKFAQSATESHARDTEVAAQAGAADAGATAQNAAATEPAPAADPR
jgi:hypothetical protein